MVAQPLYRRDPCVTAHVCTVQDPGDGNRTCPMASHCRPTHRHFVSTRRPFPICGLNEVGLAGILEDWVLDNYSDRFILNIECSGTLPDGEFVVAAHCLQKSLQFVPGCVVRKYHAAIIGIARAGEIPEPYRILKPLKQPRTKPNEKPRPCSALGKLDRLSTTTLMILMSAIAAIASAK